MRKMIQKAFIAAVISVLLVSGTSCKKDSDKNQNEEISFTLFGSVSKDYIINYNYYPDLTLYDCKTENETIFCTLPNCEHNMDDENCQAYSEGEFSCVFIRNGYTYYFDSSDMSTKIYKRDSDGGGKKNICEIDGNTSNFSMYDGKLYFLSIETDYVFDETGEDGDVLNKYTIYSFDLENEKVTAEVDCGEKSEAFIGSYYVYENKIAYKITYYDDDENYGCGEYVYDLKSKKRELFSDCDDYQYFGIYGSEIYYVSQQTDKPATAIYKFDINTLKNETVLEKELYSYAVVNNYLIYKESVDSKECTMIDLDNGEEKKVSLNGDSVIPKTSADGFVFGEYYDDKTSGNIARMSLEDFESGNWDKYMLTPGIKSGSFEY